MNVDFRSAVNAYNQAANVAKDITPSSGKAGNSQMFSDMLHNAVGHTESSLNRAESLSSKALVNQADITDVVSAVSSAELTLQTVIAVRDRLVTAVQDIMKMPV